MSDQRPVKAKRASTVKPRKAEEKVQAIVGRPALLTPETQESIIKAIRAGAYVETAAAFAGIDRKTFYYWLGKGRKSNHYGKYYDFLVAVEKAMADAEVNLVGRVTMAAAEDWRAAGWMLERRFPERYGLSVKVKAEVEKEIHGFLRFLSDNLSATAWAEVERLVPDLAQAAQEDG